MNATPQGTKATQWLTDPCKFTKMCWPDLTLYPKQREVLHSLRDNVQTFVHAGNELGKDFITGLAVVWFYASRTPCRVITSSAGETQLKSVLWGEMKQRIATSQVEFPWNVTHLNIKQLDTQDKEVPLSYCLGHVTKSVENFQGHHLDHDIPRVLGVFDEASGIPDEFYVAAESWAHRILVIGNPLRTTNFFFRICKAGNQKDPAAPKGSKKKLINVIHIGAEHSPNVQLGKELAAKGYEGEKGWPNIIPGVLSYTEYLRRKQQWDPIKQQQRLYGHFYEGSDALLYPPDWLDMAEEVYEALFRKYSPNLGRNACQKRRAVALGVDPGEGGTDPTCFTVVDQLGVIMQHEVNYRDTMRIAGMIQTYLREYSIPARMCCIDLGGGGKQIADRLAELNVNIRTVAFGGSATSMKDQKPPKNRQKKKQENEDVSKAYKNRRCEMYGLLRDRLNPTINPQSFAIPEELNELRTELACHPLWYDSNGTMCLPPKDRPPHVKHRESDEITIKKLLGHSPNRADSLVLANFAMTKPAKGRKLGTRR